MDATAIIGLLAALFTTAANVPQTYLIIRERSTREVSTVTYLMLFLGNGLWVTYGVIKEDWPIMLTNAFSTLTCLIILLLNFSPQKVINNIHQTVLPEKIQKEARKASRSKKSK